MPRDLTLQDATAADAPMGRREANKRDKLVRIRNSAREVFLAKGFDDATLREIADGAGVAFGTLFLYAKNKQDLLLLLFDDELPEVTRRAFERAHDHEPIVDQMMAFFAEFYVFFSRTPTLSRDMMRENTMTDGIVSARIWEGVLDTEAHLARIVARAQADHNVSSQVAPGLAAHVAFSLYFLEIRFCFDDDDPDLEGSMNHLRRQLEVLYEGLRPTPPARA